MRLSRNEIKIKFGKQEFTINEKKKEITCKLFFDTQFPSDYDGEILFVKPSKECVIATTVCTGGDEFDEYKGRKIALAKAENAAYRLVQETLKSAKLVVSGTPNHHIEVATAMLYLVNEFKNKVSRCTRHNMEYINSLFDEVPEE